MSAPMGRHSEPYVPTMGGVRCKVDYTFLDELFTAVELHQYTFASSSPLWKEVYNLWMTPLPMGGFGVDTM